MTNSSLDGPMVYLAPERHAFLVLGNAGEPLITWSRSYRFACEQADIHFGTVVAVPVVHDMAWRQPTHEGPATQVPVPAYTMPRMAPPADLPDAGPTFAGPVPAASMPRPADVCELGCGESHSDSTPAEPAFEGPAVTGWTSIATIAAGGFTPAPLDVVSPVTGYPLGRVASGEAGWSAARPDVVGQDHVPVGPAEGAVLGTLVQRVRPFGDPAASELPMDREEALRAAFGGAPEAMAAFHAASQADVGTLEAVRAGLAEDREGGSR